MSKQLVMEETKRKFFEFKEEFVKGDAMDQLREHIVLGFIESRISEAYIQGAKDAVEMVRPKTTTFSKPESQYEIGHYDGFMSCWQSYGEQTKKFLDTIE